MFNLDDYKFEKKIDVQLPRAGKYDIIVHMIQPRPLLGSVGFCMLDATKWKEHAAAITEWKRTPLNDDKTTNNLPIWHEYCQHVLVRRPPLPLNLRVWNVSAHAAECEISVELHYTS